MPSELYLVRLIHHHGRKAFASEPLRTGLQLSRGGAIRFLPLRHREGVDVYLQPHSRNNSARYVFLDLDSIDPNLRRLMRA